jgi:hypothetical protein
MQSFKESLEKSISLLKIRICLNSSKLRGSGDFGSICATDFGAICASDFGSNCAIL